MKRRRAKQAGRLVVGVTGHRILAETDKIEEGVRNALTAIRERFPGRAIDLLSALAEGADRIAANEAIPLPEARLLAALPLLRAEYEKDFESAQSKAEFAALLRRAAAVIELPAAPTRNEAYEEVGLYVLENCDVLLAVWDGNVEQGRGGTGAIVTEARRRKIPVAWVHAGNRKPGTTEPTSLGADQGIVTCENVASEHPPKPRLVLRVGVTGHRQAHLDPADVPALENTVRDVLERVYKTVKTTYDEHRDVFADAPPQLRIVTRLANGVDMIIARQALAVSKDTVFECVLPFDREETERRYEFSSEQQRGEYRRLLDGAHSVVELDGSNFEVEEAFANSRRGVLRQCDVVIAIWDQAREDTPYGTARMVAEALRDQILTILINVQTPTQYAIVQHGSEADDPGAERDDIEKHVRDLIVPPGEKESSNAAATERDGHATGHTTPGRLMLAAFFRERSWRINFGWTWPILYQLAKKRLPRKVFRLPEFVAKGRGEISDEREQARVRYKVTRDRVGLAFAEPYAWSDNLANYYGNLTRTSIILNYLMAATAVLFALLGYALGWTEHLHDLHAYQNAWIIGELALIALIIANTSAGTRWRWHERWTDYRLLAEQFRVQRYLRPLALYTPFTRMPPQSTYGDARRSWMYWYLRAVRREVGTISATTDTRYLEDCRGHLLFLVENQRAFHASTASTTKRLHLGIHRVGSTLFILTGVSCAAHLLVHKAWLTFVAATFPAFGAAMAAIDNECELRRIERRSHAMAEHLGVLAGEIRTLGSSGKPLNSETLGAQARQVAEHMTVEVLDWRTLLVVRDIALPG